MEVFSFYHPKQHINLIDVFVHEPIDYKEIKKNSMKIKIGHLSIPVVSIEDLIALKRISGRPQDLADIAALEKIKKNAKN